MKKFSKFIISLLLIMSICLGDFQVLNVHADGAQNTVSGNDIIMDNGQGTSEQKGIALLSNASEDGYHTVIFLDAMGNKLIEQYVQDGGLPVLPDDPVKDKHVFKGWDPDVTAAVTGDITYT